MPLSEHEQQMLDQMERALYAEDPKFATSMKSNRGGPRRQRILLGVLAAVLGLAVVVLGVTTDSIVVGSLGFVVMVAGVAWAFAPARSSAAGTLGVVNPDGKVRRAAGPSQRGNAGGGLRGGTSGGARRPQQSSGSSFMQRMEQRWENRRDQGF